MSRSLVISAIVAISLVLVAAVVVHSMRNRSVVGAGQAIQATQPSDHESQPPRTTKPILPEKTAVPITYMDEVRAEFPSLPTTQPLAVPLELKQAARLVLKVPIYLGKARGDLWITRGDAPADAKVLKDAADINAPDTQTHIVSRPVVFVHWLTNTAGLSVPYLICPAADGTYQIVWAQGHASLPRRDYRWNQAFSWDNDRAAIPTRSGISVIRFQPEVRETYRELASAQSNSGTTQPSGQSTPQVLFDGEGLLAWIPWENGHSGSRGAVRYLDGQWTDLGPDQGWPEKIVHLVPLRDGTVFQFVAGDDGSTTVQTSSLARAPVDEQAIEKLVGQLGDIDADVRRAAMSELANYGPGAWPALTRLAEDAPPQAKLLLRELLKDKNHPTLSGMTLLGSRSLQLATHLSDGGVVFFALQGVSIPDSNGDPVTYAPAWLSVRPGHFVELLPEALVTDLKPQACGLDVVGDQWIADSDSQGPRLFFGNGFATLLRKDERQFSQVVGTDARGRWLFKKAVADDQTLIIDPHLPDPTPRLPVWNLAIAQTVGWDKDNWPVVQNGAAFAMTESDWRGLAKDEKIFTQPSQNTAGAKSINASLKRPSTRPSTSEPPEKPILVTADGSCYFGGLTSLKVVESDGDVIDWPLPPIANGTGPVTLIRATTGKLFLFNQPGRVLRIGRTTDDAEPFKVEATFTRNIPAIKTPTRIWLDPAGRIDIAWENRLAILFPEGYIPQSISEKMIDQGGLDADQN